MDFTREPIVETIITPKEGFHLVVRSSKNLGQEEYIVDSLEIVSFGTLCFYRHLERPRSFMVPASDYEVVEVREARMPLKAASFEGIVKPSAAKESFRTQAKEVKRGPSKEEMSPDQEEAFPEKTPEAQGEGSSIALAEPRHERRKDRKRGSRRRRDLRDEIEDPRLMEKGNQVSEAPVEPLPTSNKESSSSQATTLLPPPTTLIRDDLNRLRKSDQYRGAFYVKDEGPSPVVEEGEVPEIPPILREEEPIKEEDESVYKATPLPPEDEEPSSPLWNKRPSVGP